MSEEYNQLMVTLARQLGMSRQEIQAAADNGTLNDLLQSSQNPNAQQVSRILSDPQQTKKLLQSPEAQKLMRILRGSQE